MKICIVIGTRPEIIKMSPIIRDCQKKNIDFFILHTGQHYSYNMDRVFFNDLELPKAKYNLDIGSGLECEQIAKVINGAENVFLEENPDIILVQGDTNSVFATAFVASRHKIKIGHVEAGLRSNDRNMPEEINRILTDKISDFLFCPTLDAKKNALKDNIVNEKIFITGNTIVDAINQNKNIAEKNSKILNKLNIEKNKYFLTTIHRQENVDIKEKLEGILIAFERIMLKYNMPIIFPIHPRTNKMISNFELNIPHSMVLTEPLDYIDFLKLVANSRLILTDSGGIQEESCILKVPCVTLRENTERPETLDIKSNILSGTSPDKILNCMELMLNRNNDWENPFGLGNSSEIIMNILNNTMG